jgi:hypothetical protein
MCARIATLNAVLLATVQPKIWIVYQAISGAPVCGFGRTTGWAGRLPIHGKRTMIPPASRKQRPSTRSALKKRSTHRPRMKGARIAPKGPAV